MTKIVAMNASGQFLSNVLGWTWSVSQAEEFASVEAAIKGLPKRKDTEGRTALVVAHNGRRVLQTFTAI